MADKHPRTILSLKNIGKKFGKVTALHDVSVDIKEGEIFALLGPSGCGKSTLLRIISGFESPTSGELLLDGNDMVRMPANKRPVNMVFQSYAVFPHMSVLENVAYGLKMDRLPKEEIDERVAKTLAQVHLETFSDRMPDQLSGGQKQRVALARALAKQPRVLLLDEPLSALDAKLRDAMRLELVKLQKSVGVTFIIVTHDQSEALAMADRIAVLEQGRLRQVDTPTQLYKRPVDLFVADFIGGAHTFIVQHIELKSTGVNVTTEEFGTVQLPGTVLPAGVHAGPQTDTPAVLAIRPESFNISLANGNTTPSHGGESSPQAMSLPGLLGDIAFQGQHSVVEITRGNAPSLSAVVDHVALGALQIQTPGTPIIAFCSTSDALLLPAG